MNISLDQIKYGVVEFIEKDIAAKAIGLQKFMYYGVGFLASQYVDNIFLMLLENPLIKAMEVLDDKNNVDIEKVYSAAKYAMQKSGSVTVGGVILSDSDVDRIYQYIKNAQK